MKKFISFLILSTLGINILFAGAFGFEEGMTYNEVKNQSINIIHEAQINNLTLIQVEPKKNHIEFNDYILIIDEDYGLVKIIAETSHIETNRYGQQLTNTLNSITQSLSNKYGSEIAIDSLYENSIWEQPESYMMSLVKQERTLGNYWITNDSYIYIEATGISTNEGKITLTYEYYDFEKALEKYTNLESQIL